MIARLAAALLVLVLAVAPAAARPLTDAESAALAERVASFDAAMRNRDYDVIIGVIPPKILDHIATGAGTTADVLRPMLAGQMKEIFESVEIESFGMDLAGLEQRELADGEPIVFIPTRTVMDLGAELGRMQVDSQTLGMMDAGDWYLVRVNDTAMVGILRQVYPEFAGVEFPAETVTPLEEQP